MHGKLLAKGCFCIMPLISIFEGEHMQSFDELINDGDAYLADNQVDAAIEQYETAYELQQTAELNRHLVKLLCQQGQFKEASAYALEQPEAYEYQPQLFVAAVLGDDEYILAREFCISQQYPDGIQQIELAEKQRQTNLPETLQQQAKAFYHMGDASLVEQDNILRSALRLPLNEFLRGARFNLVDPFGAPIMRTSILDHLRRLAYREEVQYLNYRDEQQSVVPMNLPAPFENDVLDRLESLLAEQKDPLVADSLRQLTHFAISLTYPDGLAILKDTEDWLRAIAEAELPAAPTGVNENVLHLKEYVLGEINKIQ